MPSIAIVGAGPGLGLAIARVFGAQGYDVALVARDATKLKTLTDQLEADGVRTAGFAGDVTDEASLTAALAAAADHFGGIDVLEYSPAGGIDMASMVPPSASRVEDVQGQIEFYLYGAMAATRAVLPAMKAAGAGTLLFTTGAGSVDPVPMLGNVNAAAAALRNWSINLHKELADTGVYAAHVAIGVAIDATNIPGFPVAPASEIAAEYWQLTQSRDVPELVFSKS